MWFKILESIWKASPKDGDSIAAPDETSQGPGVGHTGRPSLQREKPYDTSGTADRVNGHIERCESPETAEPAKPNRVAHAIREYGEIVFFGSAVVVILVLGERNMFSPQIRYQQEPIVRLLPVIFYRV